MQGDTSLVRRNAFFPLIITIGDVIDSTVMYVNDFLRPKLTRHLLYSTPTRIKMTIYNYSHKCYLLFSEGVVGCSLVVVMSLVGVVGVVVDEFDEFEGLVVTFGLVVPFWPRAV